MHESTAQRLGELPKEDRPTNLPEDSHIVTGTLEGHGATSLASERAKLSSRVIKLERTASGGIDYQLAIFVSEPAPVAVLPPPPVVDQQFEAAVAYFVEKDFNDAAAREQVKRFGVDRVLAMKNKELDAELAGVLAKTPAPALPNPAPTEK